MELIISRMVLILICYLDALIPIPVLLGHPLTHHAVLHQSEHLLFGDKTIIIDIIDFEAILSLFFLGPLEEDIEPYHPLLPGDISIMLRIKIFKNLVQKNIVCHIETCVQKLLEQFPIHMVQFNTMSFLRIDYYNFRLYRFFMNMLLTWSTYELKAMYHCFPIGEQQFFNLQKGKVCLLKKFFHQLLLLFLLHHSIFHNNRHYPSF